MMKPLLLLVAALLTAAACSPPAAERVALEERSWKEIQAAARGQTVTWMMWQGDPAINAYVSSWVAPRLLERHDVILETVSGQGADIVAALMTEREAGRGESELDMVWINGETFYQLRQIDALEGPFTHRLPSARNIDFDDPFIGVDFQQPVEGYECPWGNVQLALIHDAARVPDPPRTRAALLEWVRQHPGRFSFDIAFTGMTFLKSLLIDIAGGPGSLDGPFDPQRYERHSAELWTYLRELKPHLWRRGETFPSGVAQLHQLFASGEVDFSMSNNDGEVDNKVLQGLLPEGSRAFVLDGGTIQNSHYIGIPRGARHQAGAMVVIDFLISAEAQLEKAKPAVWGDGTVLDVERLETPWPERFGNLPGRTHAPPRQEIEGRALQELAPEYMIRLYEDFRTHVLAG